MVVQVDPVCLCLKRAFNIYDFPSVASTMWVWYMHNSIKRDFDSVRESGFLENLGIWESAYPLDSVEYVFL